MADIDISVLISNLPSIRRSELFICDLTVSVRVDHIRQRLDRPVILEGEGAYAHTEMEGA